MTFLLEANPKWIYPRFRQTGLLLEYKVKPSSVVWLPFLDFSAFDGDLTTLIDDVVAILARLDLIDIEQVDQNDALAEVTDRLDLIDIEQVDQNDALAEVTDRLDLIDIEQVDQNDAIESAQDSADAALAAVAAVTPKQRRVTLFHHQSNVSGGTLTLNVNTAIIDNHQAFSLVQGFNASQSFVCDLMPACKWFFIGVTNNTSGIMGLYIDEVLKGTLDWYSSVQAVNQIKSISFAANVLTAGRHVMRLEVVTKNGSSSAYNLTMTKYWLAPDNDSA